MSFSQISEGLEVLGKRPQCLGCHRPRFVLCLHRHLSVFLCKMRTCNSLLTKDTQDYSSLMLVNLLNQWEMRNGFMFYTSSNSAVFGMSYRHSVPVLVRVVTQHNTSALWYICICVHIGTPLALALSPSVFVTLNFKCTCTGLTSRSLWTHTWLHNMSVCKSCNLWRSAWKALRIFRAVQNHISMYTAV